MNDSEKGNEDNQEKLKQREEELEKEITKARKEGKSEAWIRINLDI